MAKQINFVWPLIIRWLYEFYCLILLLVEKCNHVCWSATYTILAEFSQENRGV